MPAMHEIESEPERREAKGRLRGAVSKIKSALFGGEGLFCATLRGPGRVWLQ